MSSPGSQFIIVTKSTRNNALVRPRVQLGDRVAHGPGKMDLLRAIAEMRSISGAAHLTPLGDRIVIGYDAIEKRMNESAHNEDSS